MENTQKNNKPSFKGNYVKLATIMFVTLPGLVFMIVLLLGFDATQYELARNPIFGYNDPVPDQNNATGALLLYISAAIFFASISAILFISMFLKSKKVLGLKMIAIGFVGFVLMTLATVIPFSSNTFAFAQNLRGGGYNDNVAIFLQQDILSAQARNAMTGDNITINVNIPPQPEGQGVGQTPRMVVMTVSNAEFAGILLHFVNVPMSDWGAPIREGNDAISEKIASIANLRANELGLTATQRGAFIGQFSGPLEGRLRGQLVGMFPRDDLGNFIYHYVYATNEDGEYIYRRYAGEYRYINNIPVYVRGDFVYYNGERVREMLLVRRFNTGVRHGIEGAIESVIESAIATANYRFRHTMVWSVANMSLFGMMPLAVGGLILLKNRNTSSTEESLKANEEEETENEEVDINSEESQSEPTETGEEIE